MTNKEYQDSILNQFSDLNDPRQDINIKHKFIDIMAITISAVLCGCEHWEEIEQFGKSKIQWFKTFLELPNGIPSHDRIRAVFTFLDPVEFENSFSQWVKTIFNNRESEIVSIDGKTARRSFDSKNGRKAMHLVSAWAYENKIVLGQIKTEQKSNEIEAIPRLIRSLDVLGCIVTIDAMGCQKSIVKEIINQGAEYVIAAKANQNQLYQAIKSEFEKSESLKNATSVCEQEKIRHGRSEIRNYYLKNAPGYLTHKHTWQKFNTIGMVVSERLVNGKLSKETRHFISSVQIKDIKMFAKAVRGHWSIENSLHWQLDVSYNEDQCRKRTKNAAENFALLRKITINLLKRETSKKIGIKSKRKLAGWDNEYLEKIICSSM